MSDKTMTNHIMVDIETLGEGQDAAIAAIGACRFHLDGSISDYFYKVVDLKNSKSPGVLNASTVYWWFEQSEEARKELIRSQKRPLEEVLADFTYWMTRAIKVDTFWSNGPLFDERILRDACKRNNQHFPVPFRASRCCRTIFAQRGEIPKIPRSKSCGTSHNAGDDAWHQAQNIAQIMRIKGLTF